MELDELFAHLASCKELESEARDRRIEAEKAIIDTLGCKDEGSTTTKTDQYTVTITGKINRTLDPATWENIKSHVPESLHPVKYKPEIDLTGLRWLEQNDKGVYATVCQAISAKPGKPSVTIKPTSKE